MSRARRVPLDPDLYDAVVEEAKHRFEVWPSAYASGWVVKTYKERGGKYAGQARGQDTGLTKWFGEEWVDLSRPIHDDDGNLVGYEPCGRKSSDDPADYPKCRPLAEAMQMTPEEVADAIRRKRRAERQVEHVVGRSRAPVRVPTYREDEDMRRNPPLLLLNPAAARESAASMASRYAERIRRRQTEARQPAPQPRDMLGVVVNPKTFAPCFACTIGVTSDRSRSSMVANFVEIYDDFDTASQGREYRSSWAGRGLISRDLSFSGFPIVHTGGDSGEGVREKHQGYGTALYTALCLGATLAARGKISIQNLEIHRWGSREFGEGIASARSGRTADAAAWWHKAIAHGMAYSEEAMFDAFPFDGGADRFCVVVGASDWFSTTYKGSTADTTLAPDVLATLNLAGCDPRVVAYLEEMAKLHGATKEFRKALAVADVVEHAGMRMNPEVGFTAKERRLLEEREDTIHTLGLDVPFDD